MLKKSESIYNKVQHGKYYEALVEAEKLFRRHPNNITCISDYINILINIGQFDKAEKVLEQIKKSPDTDLGIFNLYIDLYTHQGNIDKLKQFKTKFGDEWDTTFDNISNITSIDKKNMIETLKKIITKIS